MIDFPVSATLPITPPAPQRFATWNPVAVSWFNRLKTNVDTWLFAVNYGVVANGKFDNHITLPNAINAARATGRPLMLPHGEILTSVQITRAGVSGLIIAGQGRYNTYIKPHANFTGDSLWLDDSSTSAGRVYYTLLQGMTIDATGFNTRAFDQTFGGQKNVFRDVIFQGDRNSASSSSVTRFKDQGANRFENCEYWCDYASSWAVEFEDENLAMMHYGTRWAGVGNGLLVSHKANLTFTASEVSISADTITITSHGMTTGQRWTLSHGAAPGGLTTGTIYYSIVVDANTIQVASSYENAVAGTEINLTTTGTGTGTLIFFRHEGGQFVAAQGATTGDVSARINTSLNVTFTGGGLDQFNDIGIDVEASADNIKTSNFYLGHKGTATGSNLCCVMLREDAGGFHEFNGISLNAYSYGFTWERTGTGNLSHGSITNCTMMGFPATAKAMFNIDSASGSWLIHGNKDSLASPTAYNGTWELRETDNGNDLDLKDNTTVASTGAGAVAITVTAASTIRSEGTRGPSGTDAVRLDNKGVDNPATASSGSFAHGLAVTPTYGLLTLIQNGTSRFIEIDTIDATNINWKTDNTINAAAQIAWCAEVLFG